ncbi:MAG: HAMP domain-containing histidine kinase [Spirochaetes bacterium]|nr:HAMP domain-containing histidine kinase [Spirochaetota bacterium]
MKQKFSISLKTRLAFTYAVFISVTLGLLILAINHFSALMFNSLVKENIEDTNMEIVRMVSGQRHGGRQWGGRGGGRGMGAGFNPPPAQTLDAIGDLFVQQGHIISIQDAAGNTIWSARQSNPQLYYEVMGEIRERMRSRGVPVELQTASYPLFLGQGRTGTVNIETYGPFFYSESEYMFLESLSRLLFFTWIILTILSLAVSVPLSRTIASPILKAKEAARQIAAACADAGGKRSAFFEEAAAGRPIVRVDEDYATTELAELSQSINSLSAEIEEGERRQKQLVSDIAHELRTPLSCLQGTIEAMIDNVYPADREHLESCHEEITRLAGLVSDLGTLTSLEWNKIELNKSEFDLSKLLDFTARQFMPQAMEKGIEIKLALGETPVAADYERLKQVFANILSNAVKYTDRGSISIAAESAGGQCLVRISDTGIGIPQSDLPRIFERFYRSDKSRSRDTGGAGIGLSIAAAIVAAHGGAISAKSIPAGGTEFSIRLSALETGQALGKKAAGF